MLAARPMTGDLETTNDDVRRTSVDQAVRRIIEEKPSIEALAEQTREVESTCDPQRVNASTTRVRSEPAEFGAWSPHLGWARPRNHVRTLQMWEGTVIEVHDQEFTAVLRDLTDPDHDEENATFPIEQLAEDDLPLLKPGHVFYWHVGYRTERGTKQTFTEIRFRRLPTWSERDVERIVQRAARYDDIFGSDDDND
jgi:hypothetical protein